MIKSIFSLSLLAFAFASCGDSDDAKKTVPPPVDDEKEGEAFALTKGQYTLTQFSDYVDGCGTKLLDSSDSIVGKSFALENDGTGRVSLALCAVTGLPSVGVVSQNSGALSRTGFVSVAVDGTNEKREYNKSCEIRVVVVANNELKANVVIRETNRNKVHQFARGDNLTQCETSFTGELRRN
jgi:hypothetical protein